MLKLDEYPKLRGFSVHGVSFITATTGEPQQGVGVCPFCGKEKFYVNTLNRLWDCKACQTSGNFEQFLDKKAAQNARELLSKPAKLAELATSRGINPQTLLSEGLGWDGINYTIPIQRGTGLADLRLYSIGGKLRSTPGIKTYPIGLDGIEADGPVYICEGEWDYLAFREARAICPRSAGVSVIGLPGAGVFKNEWAERLAGRDVICVYDNDPAGLAGELKALTVLKPFVRSIKFIHWPETVKAGFDLRDCWLEYSPDSVTFFKALEQLTRELPRSPVTVEAGPEDALTGDGLPRQEIIKAYQKWLHLPNPEVIDVLYATLLANRLPGDPLWMFLIAPPGGSKSELLMSLSEAPLITLLTTLTPKALISGMHVGGDKDPSLIPKLNNRVLIVKDFTTILSMQFNYREEILGIFRDAYDGQTGKMFGNIVREYNSKFGFIAGVTSAIECFNTLHTTLGERFLRYRLDVRAADTTLIQRALENLTREGDMRGDLKLIANEALNYRLPTVAPLPAWLVSRIVGLAQWTALCRGAVQREKYTKQLLFKPTSEIGTRLAKQLGKLALGLSLHYRSELHEEHYRIIAKVARDTIPDRAEEMIRRLWLNGGKTTYLPTKELAQLTRMGEETSRSLLEDLVMLQIVERDPTSSWAGRWRLSAQLVRLMAPLKLYAREEKWKKGSANSGDPE